MKFVFKLLLFSLFFLALIVFRFIYVYSHEPVYPKESIVTFETTLHAEPELRDGKQRVKVKTPDNVTVHVVLPAFPLFHYGDHLQFQGKLTESEYEGYKYWSLYFPRVTHLQSSQNILMQSAVALKQHARDLFEQTLSPVGGGLLMGILFGGKQGLPESFSEQLRTTGVYHVIAASGMNVSFVAGALLSMLGKFMRRQLALLIGIVGIIFYAFLAEFEPSIVRASIMAIFAFSAMLLGRQNIALVAIFLTAYLMLFYDPHLLSDVGFQLSFLSTLGILLIKPIISFGKSLIVTEDITTTIAAQIATLPILLGTFGQYGLLSVFANAFVLWTIPLLMFFGSVALLLSFIWQPLGIVVLWCCMPLLAFFEYMILLFSSFGGLWVIESLPLFAIIGYYVICLAAVLYFQKKGKQEKEKSLIDEIGI